jgi:HemY protein
MKYLLFGFVLLLLSIWLGLEISRGAGYVLIAYRHWSVETSLWVAIICLIALFVVMYFIFRTLGRTTRIAKKIRQWRRMRHYRQSRHLTNVGLCELAEGNWQRAEHTLLKAAKMTKSPLNNYLAAAQAANAQQAYDRRDNYLRKADATTKGSTIAVGLTQAQLQINSNQWEQALATLQHLYRIDPHHAYTLTLLKTVYLKLNDWQKLHELLPQLRKHKVDSSIALDALEKMVALHLLMQANLQGIRALHTAWDSFPRRLQHDYELINHYARYLISHHDDSTAIPLIEHVLKKEWHPELAKLYGLAKSESPAKQLTTAEDWLQKYPHEPELLLCLGRLSAHEKFLGKARDYFRDYIRLTSSPLGYQELARVYLSLGDKNAALESLQKGFSLEKT